MLRPFMGLTLVAGACAAPAAPPAPEKSAADTLPLAECGFRVIENVYAGADWWGTIRIANDSKVEARQLTITFDVPAGATCDHAESGWSYTTKKSTCTYEKSTPLAAGAIATLLYSANTQGFSAANDIRVSAAACGVSTPLQWRRALLTSYTSYPEPGSEECVKYSGCEYMGEFAALRGKQPESWVEANNIVAVHSKHFEKYKLRTLRLRQGSKEIDVKVYDQCADSDCDGCCTANLKETGFLIDAEKYTAQRFGTEYGIVDWACLDCQ